MATLSGAHGGLRASFQVPLSPLGTYHVVASVHGIPMAVAKYIVSSAAVLALHESPTSSGVRLFITGTRFVPRTRLVLIAIALSGLSTPIRLGTINSGQYGRFALEVTKRLAPGQYILRALSADYDSGPVQIYFSLVT